MAVAVSWLYEMAHSRHCHSRFDTKNTNTSMLPKSFTLHEARERKCIQGNGTCKITEKICVVRLGLVDELQDLKRFNFRVSPDMRFTHLMSY